MSAPNRNADDLDELLERIDDAIEKSLLAHESLDNDAHCSCGAQNNMDGDVLHGHRLGAVSDAVRGALRGMGIERERSFMVKTNNIPPPRDAERVPCARYVTRWERTR